MHRPRLTRAELDLTVELARAALAFEKLPAAARPQPFDEFHPQQWEQLHSIIAKMDTWTIDELPRSLQPADFVDFDAAGDDD